MSEQIMITGTFSDPDGVTVSGVEISAIAIANSSGTFRQRSSKTITSETGEYSISLFPGTYRVRAFISNENRTIMLGDILLEDGSPTGTLNDYLIFSDPQVLNPTVYAELKRMHAQARQASKTAGDIAFEVDQKSTEVNNAARQAGESAETTKQVAEQAKAYADSAGAASVEVDGAREEVIAARDEATAAAETVGQTEEKIMVRVDQGAPFPAVDETQEVLSANILDGTHPVSDEKTMMPRGKFTGTRWARNRGKPTSFAGFMLKGQGSRGTVIKHPKTGGVGDHMFADNLTNAYIGGFTLDNTDLGPGTSQADAKNGQMWITRAEDTQFDDIAFAGGDVLSFALAESKNVMSTDLKVEFQYRYPTSYSKSPLIVGDFSEKCMFICGYVRSVSRDGKNIYTGDLADNDQANDSKWAFINLIGLPYSVKPSLSAAMWQEGEDALSNSHNIGMNYYGHGIGHGISEQAIGTDIGCSTRETQGRGVWNLNYYFGLGGHFFDVKGENTGFASQTRGAVYSDNARMTASIGQFFSGNVRDFADYSTATTERASGMFSVCDNLSASFYVGSTKTARHHGLTSSRLDRTATITNSGQGNHLVLMNTLNVGPLGQLSSAPGSVTDVVGSTFFTDQADSLLSQAGTGYNNFKCCVIRGYSSIGSSYQASGYIIFDSCTFFDTTFTADDLNRCRFVNCMFVNCINAPDAVGLNVAADSAVRPASARVEMTVAAGQVYKVPTWLVEARGVYDIKIGGRRQDNDYCKVTIAKKNAHSNGVITVATESTPGSIAVAWPPDSAIEIQFAKAGSYYVKIG